MGNKIVTEADRKRTPAPTPLPGTSARTGGRGQRVSLERGVSTRSKKILASVLAKAVDSSINTRYFCKFYHLQ